MRTKIGILVAVVATLYLGVCVTARVLFRRFLYPGSGLTSGRLPEGVRVLALQARDGAAVHALEVARPANASPAPTLVFFHGNGELAEHSIGLARHFAERGYGAVIVEYRGYGLSKASGPPTESGLYADAEAVLAHLAQDPARSPTILVGTSLGTGVAIAMAAGSDGDRPRPAALVLFSPYTSIRDVAQRSVPLLPMRIVASDVFDSRSRAPRVTSPTLIVHGEDDALIPVAMGRALADAIPHARFLPVPHAGHNDILARDGDHVLAEVLAHIAAATAGAPRASTPD